MTKAELIEVLRQFRETASDEDALKAVALYTEWAADTDYTVDQRIRYEDVLYKCLQAHTSQEQWKPVDAPSLWTKVLIPTPGEIPEWEQPSSTNGYAKGDKVKHNSKTWESLVDNNVWEPGITGTESLWKEITE
mgnify:CR=1 FL=1